MTTTKVALPNLDRNPVLFEADLDEVPLLQRGKVRDVFDLGEHALLVATDRMSVNNVVMATPVPLKGRVLTRMCAFWFDQTRHIIGNHFVTTDLDEMKELGCDLSRWRDQIEGRCMLVRKAQVLPVACVVRGYLYGSGWREYRETRTVCGHPLRRNMRIGARLPRPMFTPATQRPEGGREANICWNEMVEIVGQDVAEAMRDASMAIYEFASRYCLEHGIILADTKLEFGLIDDEVILIDEIITPDSSRLWPKSAYTPGKHQLAFDKQFIRDYLDAIDWNRRPPGPELPEKVIMKSAEKYVQACQQLLGQEFA